MDSRVQPTLPVRHLSDVDWAIERSPYGGFYGYAWNPQDGKGLLMTANANSAEAAQELLKRRLCERLGVGSNETLQSASGSWL